MTHTPPHSERNRAAEAIKKANEALPLDSPHRLTEAEVAANFFATNTTPPHNGTGTSKAAAESMKPHRARVQGMVLKAISEMPGGMTCQEVEHTLGMNSGTVTPRINELASEGLITKGVDENGEVIRRKNLSGRSAYVWFRVEEA